MDSNHRYPAEFFWLPPSIPPIHLRNINRLPRDRDRWFESISLQRRVSCELPGDGNQVDREAFVDQKPHDTAMVSRPRRVRWTGL